MSEEDTKSEEKPLPKAPEVFGSFVEYLQIRLLKKSDLKRLFMSALSKASVRMFICAG